MDKWMNELMDDFGGLLNRGADGTVTFPDHNPVNL
jgi:hypothetical protein